MRAECEMLSKEQSRSNYGHDLNEGRETHEIVYIVSQQLANAMNLHR